jgi:raffinose/stachyose/melibiose transport system substrate-binding protein
MAAVIHGFMYNADAFAELGLTPPTTEAEFFEVLEAIQEDGSYIPLAMGTADQWEAATMGYTNIGPAYWDGEEGRQALIDGSAEFTDAQYIEPYEVLERWADYMGRGYQAQSYSDSQNLFTLGRAAIYPTGSWEITGFRNQAIFELGAFPPPVPEEGATCYISDHTDIGLGMNAATEHPEAARTFLDWVASAEFAELYTNALPGFFSLSSAPFEVEDPLAQEFISWRESCESTIRLAHQILSRGEPNTWNRMWTVSANVLNDAMTPEEAAGSLQEGLEDWYEPQQD